MEMYREYPQAKDAEIWLLGGIFQDPKSLGEVSLILRNGTEFYLEKHQAIWNAMLTLTKSGNPIDVMTVADVLEKNDKLALAGGKDYLFTIMESVPSAANIDYYAEIIHSKYILRELIFSSNKTIKEALELTANTEEVLQATEKRIFDLVTEQVKENTEPLSKVAIDFLNKLATRKNELSGCPTDFKDLDNLTNGLQKTDLIILAARPSMGKTALALNIAVNAAKQNKTVLFFSLEMNMQQLAIRVLSSEAEIDLSKLRQGKIDTETINFLLVKSKEMESMSLFIDDSSEVRAFDLISKCRIFKRKHNNNLDLVIVDYLQMMKINGNSENRAVGVAENSRMLKVLAKELQIPVLALAQLNRNVENRPTGSRPQLSDLRDSGSIEQDADIVCFIHRPAKEKEKRRKDDYEILEEEKREAHLIIAKNRNGPTTDIQLEFHGEFTKFKDHRFTPVQHPNDYYLMDFTSPKNETF
ncbi:MAG: replicative DNA helicase [Fibromonadaceae bacterium]|jgi:replicative DNA helicase|nr:replicative DNA helicase [Fibromonadaceae bacterium]